ncbi:acyl esterase [Embleya scabrispora]|uniref:Acyl esterase n=1 Tax=Embleya scabrispora TaxID=159449 RepID=A0A1T3NTR3_9ACTN|nr:alpha/beta fold hydrolase [Embleya scabrispora]OPC80080.1 acyl esterase [Embleya scabrispora]
MGRFRLRPRARAAAVVSAAILAGTALGPAAPAGAAPAPTTAAVVQSAAGSSLRFVDIPGDGGTKLAANIITPTGGAPGTRYPVVVLPTSWAMPQIEYVVPARQLAERGYVVIGYNSRGFWQSGGEIETAGPPDIADASRVIDWALANTPADPARIGMAGVSYGAGISLLASAFDPRIKAVVAMSGWADLIESIYAGRTEHAQAAALLGGAGFLTGRPSAELTEILKNFLSGNLAKEPEMLAWGAKRSPVTHLDRINANAPAIMLGNAWGDSLFPPDQYADFFGRLTGPKRLEFRPGDHATAEAGGLLGLPNDVWADSTRWLDHHLRGIDNGIDREPAVQLKSRTGGGYEGYPNWPAAANSTRTLALTDSRRILTGIDSGADGGTIFLSSILDQFLKAPPTASIPLLPRAFAAVWQSDRYSTPTRVRGTTKLHTTITASHESGTIFAYLYDVGPLGIGKLVTHAPYTFHAKTPGTPFPISLDLTATSYDVPAGHSLAAVIDTVDPLYLEHNPLSSQLTFTSPQYDPSTLTIPIRN